MFTLTIPPLHRGRRRILEALELRLERGSLTGIVGPNGAGKSTLLRAIAGLGQEEVRITDGPRRLTRRDVGFLPQSFAVQSELSVLDCVLLGRREELGWRVSERAVAAAQKMLARFDLAALASRPMRALSGGQQQRVLLVQRLYRGSDILALDEPTSALDLHHQLASLAALQRHAASTGSAAILALHDLTLAARYCDRIAMIADGRLICHAAPETTLSPARVGKHWKIRPEFLRDHNQNLIIVPHE